MLPLVMPTTICSHRRLAVAATKGNLKQLEQRKHNIAAREEDRVAEAQDQGVLDALTVKVEARVGEEGVLFGSVTSQMIVERYQGSG